MRFGVGEGYKWASRQLQFDYGVRRKFSFLELRTWPDRHLYDLIDLQNDLEQPKYTIHFASELRKHPITLIFEQFNENDDDELLLVKVLHEVRVYIHLYRKKHVALSSTEAPITESSAEERQIKANIAILHAVEKEVSGGLQTEDICRKICQQCIEELDRLQESPIYMNNDQDFCEALKKLLWSKYDSIQTIMANDDTRLSSTSRTADQVQETVM